MADIRRLPVLAHSIHAEQALLGSLLLSPSAFVRVHGKVGAADFYRPDHRSIFGTIASLHAAGRAIDAVTVSEALERQGNDAGGLAYISQLAKDTPTADNVEDYARVVRDRSSRRRLKQIGDGIVAAATSPGGETAAELVANAQEALQQLQSRARTGNGLVEARTLVNELTDDLDARATSPQGLKLGLDDLDDATCGLEAGDLVVFAARPGLGKSALMVSIGSHTSQRVETAIFSAEMPARQLMRRTVALRAEVSQGGLRKPETLSDAEWEKIATAASLIGKQKLWIDDTPTPSLSHIRSECLSLRARAGLGLVLIDYVQLVKGAGKNRYEELRDVAYGLKALAKELGVPIIVLAQLNRGVEARDNKRPAISDLRDSGAIEEAADIVGLLYSEAYYDHSFLMPYVLECSVEKNRNGERGQFLWRFDGAYSRVTVLEAGAAAEYRRLLSPRKQRGNDL